jgi:hypothetical protein
VVYAPTFRDNLSVPSTRVKCILKMGPVGCPETSVLNQPTLRNSPEDVRINEIYCCINGKMIKPRIWGKYACRQFNLRG